MKKNYIALILFVFGSILTSFAQECPAPGNFMIYTTSYENVVAEWDPSTFGTDMWDLLVMPAGSTAPASNEISPAGTITLYENFYTLATSVPNTRHDVYVRKSCGPGSVWAGPLTYGGNSDFRCSATLTHNLDCDNPATVSVTVTGGSGSYEYSINSGISFQSSNTFTITQGGVYIFTVRDAVSGAMAHSGQIVITQPFPPTITAAIVDNTILVTAFNGDAPYRVRIIAPITTPFQASGIFTHLSPGTYTIEVIDRRNCTATTTVTLIPVIANDDAFTVYPVNGEIATSVNSVFSNDYQGANLIDPSAYVLSTSTLPTGFSLNPTGTVSVLPGTPNGVYTFDYYIWGTNNINIGDAGTVTITVANEGIAMNAFVDTNNNGTKESGEPYFTHGQFGYELNNNGTVNYVTSSNGNYFINESNPANSYDLTYSINPDFASQYNLTTTGYADVSFNPASGITVYSFPVTQVPFTDLQVGISPSGTPPRPGFYYQNIIMYRNNGNQTVTSGTLTFTKDSNVALTNVSEAAAVDNATGFTFSFTNLLPGETRYIYVTMQVPTIPTVSLGQRMTNTIAASVPVTDFNPGNNTGTLTQTIVGSYDPNDKTEAHGGKILHSAFTSNDYLTYTIQFENTGTYPAENVKVVDVLDAGLDETSVKMVNASHEYNLKRVGNHLSWSFEGIDLPPSVANTNTGHGYITFKIKPKPGYAIGDIIPNTASIYFDFNPAIVTNTYTTEFVNALNIDAFDKGAFTLYPNPTNGLVTVALKDKSMVIDALNVVDVTGKTVYSKAVSNSSATVDLTPLANGMYFIKLKANHQEQTVKIIKE